METPEWRIEEESEERSVGQVLLCHMYTVAQCCAIFLCYQSSWPTSHKQSNTDTRVDETDNQMNRVDETEFGLDGSKLTGGRGLSGNIKKEYFYLSQGLMYLSNTRLTLPWNLGQNSIEGGNLTK